MRLISMCLNAIVLKRRELRHQETSGGLERKKPADEGKEGEDLVGRKGLPIGSPTLAHL